MFRKVGDLTADEVDLRCEAARTGRDGVARRSSSPSGGPSRSRSAARPASPPPRTPPATATRSAARCRSGCRWRSPTRCRGRSRSSSAATPAPTVRSSPPTSPVGSARRPSGSPVRSPRSRARSGWSSASSARGRVARVVRRRRAAPAAPSLARRAAQGGRAGRAGGVRPLPHGVARHPGAAARDGGARRDARRAVGHGAGRVDARDRRAARCGSRASGRRCSTSCAPPARSSGSAPVRSAPRDGRVRLCFADQLALLAPGWEQREHAEGALHDAIRTLLAEHGASFWGQLRGAAPGAQDQELLAALWDLVWAGEVTNDSLAPLRAVIGGAKVRRPRRVGRRTARSRPRPGRLDPHRPTGRAGTVEPRRTAAATGADADRGGPRAGDCSWSSATAWSPARRCWPRVSSAGSAPCTACSRCSRNAARCAAATSSTASAPPSSPFPGAVDRLRSARETPDPIIRPDDVPDPLVLAATDPAQPYGAALDWPDTAGRPARSASSLVVLRAGRPLVWFDRRGHHLVVFPDALLDPSWADALATLVKDRPCPLDRGPQGRRRRARRRTPRASCRSCAPPASSTAIAVSPTAVDRSARTSVRHRPFRYGEPVSAATAQPSSAAIRSMSSGRRSISGHSCWPRSSPSRSPSSPTASWHWSIGSRRPCSSTCRVGWDSTRHRPGGRCRCWRSRVCSLRGASGRCPATPATRHREVSSRGRRRPRSSSPGVPGGAGDTVARCRARARGTVDRDRQRSRRARDPNGQA